jgi:DNA-binding NtrC family response regulator
MSAHRKLLFVGNPSAAADLTAMLAARGWEVATARNLKAARPLMRHQEFLVALLALEAGGRDVTAEFEACRECNDACEWVALLAPGALDASPALRELVLRHFFDHHTQPADPAFLARALGHAWGRGQLRSSAKTARSDDLGLTGRSAAITQLRRLLRRAAAADACVLIEGETGTGKEVAARALHACSQRAASPLVVINCGALESESRDLFEGARGATLFLDHVSELPLDWQARLLRFLAEEAVLKAKLGREGAQATRVVSACEMPLAEAVAAKRFRQDLFYRLNVIPLAVPPLRQRREDIEPLALHFLSRSSCGETGRARGFSRRAFTAMKEHTWPGNVRELANRVERAALLAEGRLIGPDDLGLQEHVPQPLDSLEAMRVQAEKNAITLSLDRFSHNVSLAARELGVSRMTMYRLMAKHSITPRASA